MATAEAYITPRLLQWARARYFPTVAAAAEKLKFSAEKWAAWEQGDARPTFRQAQKLADRLHVPFGYLFLSEPPNESLPLPDLRTVANQPQGKPSPDFLEVLQDVLSKHEWYRDYQEDEGRKPLPFVARLSVSDGAETIAHEIRDLLRLSEVMLESPDRRTFIRQFTRNAENVGILVLRSRVVRGNQHRKLNVQEFRGFAISDPIAPMIFVNSNDFEGAQIFTLAHEVAHILLGETGISNPNYRESIGQQNGALENVCDSAAAEALMPHLEFSSYWRDHDTVESNLRLMTRRYRASTLATLRRAYDLDKITQMEYWGFYDSLSARRPVSGSKPDGGNPYATLFVRNSRRFTETVVQAVSEGRLLYLDAANLLNARVQTIDGAAQRLFGGAVG